MAAPAAPVATPSVFSSIFGGGTVQATDTNKATEDIANLNSKFTFMSSSLTTSISVATELSPELKDVVDTTSLTSALDSTKNLQETCKGLSTDDCAKKQAQLQAETDAAQLKFYKDTLAAQITLLTKQRDKIQAQYDAIKSEKAGAMKNGALVFKGESVFASYDALLARINTDITTLSTSVPYIVSSTEGFQTSPSSVPAPGSGSGSALTKPPYVIPSVTLATDYDVEHEQILATYNSLMGNPYDVNRIMRNVKTFIYRRLVPIAFYITLALSVLWGGIVCSNMFREAEQDFLPARIWYFIHGMIGFPAVLAYSLYKPPYWVSGLFPLYARVITEEEEGGTEGENSNEQNTNEQNTTEENTTEEEAVENTSGTDV
jgi:hypothetical protein